MKVIKISVDNYRILQTFELDLEDTLSLIIGKNNCGKTSLLSALDKFIGTKSSINSFAWDDFSISFQKNLKMLIEKNKITNEDEESFPIGISLNLYIEYNNHDNISNISDIMMDLDISVNIVVIEFCYSLSLEMLETLKNDYQNYIPRKNEGCNTQDTIISGETKMSDFCDFMKDNYKKYFKIEKKTREYDKKTKCAGSLRRPIENNSIIDKIIHFKSINARRTVSNSETNNALSYLSSEYYRRIEKKDSLVQTIEEFKKLVTETDVKLNSIYQGVFGGIIDKIRTFGGIKEGDTDVKILSSLQSRELLKGNTTVKYTHDENYQLPENYNGLGYLNLIGMIFEIEVILSEFRKDGKANEMPADINLFFIEEPEAHTHPQMQYVFINNIKSILVNGSQIEGGEVINLQSIISTHSSHIVSESDFDDIKYFYIAKDKYVKAKNLKSLEVEYKKDGDEGVQRFKFLKQYLTLHRSELFFADKAIFIEGETERILLPSIMKKIDQEKSNENSLPLCSQNISIIEVGNYSHIFDRFIDFIGVKSLIITDIDPAKPYEKKETNSNVSEHTPLTKCKSKDATTTTNASLRHYFAYYLTDKENAFCRLRNLDTSQKSLIKSNSDTFGWESSDSGNLMVVFQVEEKTTDTDTDNSYLAGSFEDAFIYLNRQFIKGNQKIFQSLKNKEYFDDSQKDAWDLAQKCIDKKTSFAIEIILASNDRSDNWTIPKYIKEGLIWLKKN